MEDKDSNEPSEEEYREYESENWGEKGGSFGNFYFPNIDSSKSENKEVYIEAVEVECRNCSIKTIEKYDTPITKIQYLEYCVNKICPQCKKPYQLNPIEVGFESEQKQKATKNIYTREEWQTKLFEKYTHLKDVANNNLVGLWDSLEFELSIQKILNLKDCTLPFAGIVLGAPSSLKTVGIESFRKWINTFYTDNFSAKAFVSHSTNVKKEALQDIDLLPKIKDKLFLTPELSPTFSKKDDDLVEILGILTRVLDGHGYESDTGAHGHRGYNEAMMFVWIGAAVDIPYKVHKLLGTLGPKLYFLRLPSNPKSEDYYINDLDKDFGEKIARVNVALFEYLNLFEMGPDLHLDEKSGINKMEWDSKHPKNDEDKKTKTFIVRLGMLLAHLRGVIPSFYTDDSNSQGLGYSYSLATIEEPSRAMTQLRNLARGHALSQGRNYLTMEDIPLLIKVVFSTASMERVRIFELLIEHKGRLTTSIITASLNTSNNTAKRTMAEFNALGLVEVGDVKSQYGQPEKEITLKDEFRWFLSDEFNNVRKNTPVSSNDDDDNTVRRNVNSYSKNESDITEDKEAHRGDFPYSIDIERLPVYYSEGPYPIRTENPLECPDCHRVIDPFDKNIHPACCKGLNLN